MVADDVPGWQFQKHPPQLTRRFEFATYADTRAFLDALTTLSAETGLYPDLNFGKTYVNVTIGTEKETIEDTERELAAQITALAQGGGA